MIKKIFICTYAIFNLQAASLYVANYSGEISVINTNNNTIIATVTSGFNPGAIPAGSVVSPDGKTTYIMDSQNGCIYAIQTSSNTVVATITVGSTPSGMAIAPNGIYAYVANYYGGSGTGSISVINTNTNTVVSTINAGLWVHPRGIAVTKNSNYAYVTNAGGSGNNGNVGILNATSALSTISTIQAASSIVMGPNGYYAYVGNTNATGGSNYSPLSIVDLSNNTVVSTIAMPSNGNQVAVAITPNNQYLYVASTQPSSSIYCAQLSGTGNTGSIIATINAGSGPSSIAISSNGKYAYVTNRASGSISVINTTTNSVISTITVGSFPNNGSSNLGIATAWAYLLDNQGNNLYLLDTTDFNSIVTLSLGAGLSPTAISIANRSLGAYITGNQSNVIAYANVDSENLYPSSVGSSITLGLNPEAMVLSPNKSYLYVADSADQSIYRIQTSTNTATQIATLTSAPGNLGIDPSGNYLVITMPSTSQVAMISSPDGSSTPTTNYVTVGSNPNAVAFDTIALGNAYVTCSTSGNNLYQIALSTRTTNSLSLTGINPGAISSLTIGSSPYLLIGMSGSRLVNLVNPSTFTITSSPATSYPATQLIVNPQSPSIVYLVEPCANQVEVLDFTSSFTPSPGSSVSTGNHPIGGGCNAQGTQLFILNYGANSVSAYTITGGTTLTSSSGSPISGLGNPQGISLGPVN